MKHKASSQREVNCISENEEEEEEDVKNKRVQVNEQMTRGQRVQLYVCR